MAVNSFTTEQAYTIMTEVYKEATGNKTLDTLVSKDFVSIGQAALKTGVDPVLGAISKILARTYFFSRPYDAKFKNLVVDEQKYGAITRKLYPIDDPAFETDERLLTGLSDGDSVDMYKLKKPKVVQLNWYGETVFQKHLTLFKDQLDLAFKSAEEFGHFVAMVMTAASNEIELAIENASRMALGNMINGTIASDAAGYSVGSGNRHIKLITAYNTFFGYSAGDPTANPPVAPDAGYIADLAAALDNEKFWKWAYAYIGKKIEMMGNKTELFKTALTDKPISVQTRRDQMNIWVLSDIHRYFDTMARANLYHDDYLSIEGCEDVSFWQSARTPDTVKNKPVYLKNDGTLVEASDAVTTANIAMVIADKDAVGVTKVNQWEGTTPFNVAGGFSNIYWHFTTRYWNDGLMNFIVVTLD